MISTSIERPLSQLGILLLDYIQVGLKLARVTAERKCWRLGRVSLDSVWGSKLSFMIDVPFIYSHRLVCLTLLTIIHSVQDEHLLVEMMTLIFCLQKLVLRKLISLGPWRLPWWRSFSFLFFFRRGGRLSTRSRLFTRRWFSLGFTSMPAFMRGIYKRVIDIEFLL